MNTNSVPTQHANKLQELVSKSAKHLKRGKNIPSLMYVGNSVTGFMIEVPIDLRSNNTKESSAAHARMVAAVIGSDFVITVTEGWCLPENQHPNRDEIIKRYGSIKAYPHRVEIAFFLLETHHNFHFAMVPILSSRLSGKRRQLGEVTWTCLPTVEGRFTAILPALTPR